MHENDKILLRICWKDKHVLMENIYLVIVESLIQCNF